MRHFGGYTATATDPKDPAHNIHGEFFARFRKRQRSIKGVLNRLRGLRPSVGEGVCNVLEAIVAPLFAVIDLWVNLQTVREFSAVPVNE